MAMLLDVEVAGEPGEVIPVAHLVLHFGRVGQTFTIPDRGGVVGALQRDNVADGAVVNTANRLAHAGVVAPAEAGYERQTAAPRFLGRGHDAAHAGAVHRHRFLA